MRPLEKLIATGRVEIVAACQVGIECIEPFARQK